MAKTLAETKKDLESDLPLGPKKYFQDQYDDETVLYVFRLHPIVMRWGLIFGMLGPLVGVIPAAIFPDLGFGAFFGGLALGCVLGGIIFGFSWVPWYFSVFIVTDQRFIQISQRGFFKRSVSDVALTHILFVNYEIIGVEQTLLGYGTIVIQTYVGDLVIHHVHHPAKTSRKLQLVLRDQGIVATPPVFNGGQ
jgi:hypothetical protein